MDYDFFINEWLGKSIDWDGMYGAQCVDEVAQYCSENNKPVAYANAKDWWQNPALTGAFDFIANDPNDPNQLPNRGEIVIFSGDSPGSGGFGHINIFDMQQTVDTWQGLDQNWGGQYVHFVTGHIWTYVLGWMRVKEQPTPFPAPAPAPDPAPPQPIPPAPQPDPTPPAPEPTPEPPVPTPGPEPTPEPGPSPIPSPTPEPQPTPSPGRLSLLARIIAFIDKLLGI